MRFRHAGVLVSDLKKAKDFYVNVLGFKILKEKSLTGNFIQTIMGVKGLELTYVKMCIPPDDIPVFELHHWTDTDIVYGLRNKYQAHIALTFEGDLRVFHLKNHDKIKFVSAPKRDGSTKVLVCFIEDPDGNLIELAEDLKEKKSEKKTPKE